MTINLFFSTLSLFSDVRPCLNEGSITLLLKTGDKMETFFLQKSLPSLRGKKIFPFSPGLSNLACASNYDLQREKKKGNGSARRDIFDSQRNSQPSKLMLWHFLKLFFSLNPKEKTRKQNFGEKYFYVRQHNIWSFCLKQNCIIETSALHSIISLGWPFMVFLAHNTGKWMPNTAWPPSFDTRCPVKCSVLWPHYGVTPLS